MDSLKLVKASATFHNLALRAAKEKRCSDAKVLQKHAQKYMQEFVKAEKNSKSARSLQAAYKMKAKRGMKSCKR